MANQCAHYNEVQSLIFNGNHILLITDLWIIVLLHQLLACSTLSLILAIRVHMRLYACTEEGLQDLKEVASLAMTGVYLTPNTPQNLLPLLNFLLYNNK